MRSFFFDHLPESKQRHYAGLEAMKHGYYGVSIVSKKFGIHRHTVRKGKKEVIEQTLPHSRQVKSQILIITSLLNIIECSKSSHFQTDINFLHKQA